MAEDYRHRQDRRRLIGALGLGALPIGVHRAARAAQRGAEAFPTRPIRLLVPWPAGGPTDSTLRVLADVAGRELGTRMVVENRPGAGGAVAVNDLLAEPADGHTVMQLPITIYRLPYQVKLPWDPVEVLAPILQVSTISFGVYVLASSPWRSFDAVVDYARRHPGRLVVGSTGVFSTPHLVMAELFGKLGIDFIQVPYKGTADQLNAVRSATVQVGVSSAGFAAGVDAGELRLLATLDGERSERWPTVPTLKELGYDYVATSPYGIAARQGTPAAIIARLQDAFRVAVFDPEHVEVLHRFDQSVAYLNTADFKAALARVVEQEKHWAPLMNKRT